jgi:acetylornithine/N-succinyldiaminopimelate aminotransferase
MHVDNTFYNVPQGLLAEKISKHSFGGKSFFCNSGTEAVETAIKLARLHSEPKGRFKVLTMKESFHGRTLGAITATGQEKYHKGYLPLLPGFSYVPFNDIEAARDAIDEKTCAIMLEPIQGEGGINVAGREYLTELRKLCDENDILLILDEVQSGIGRTGEWFAYQHYGIEPDIMTLAKALGGGFPIGAAVAQPGVAESLKPGTHASTFGGNPLACAAAFATFEAIEEDNLIERGRERASIIFERLQSMQNRFDVIRSVRGKGLMIGVELHKPGNEAYQYCLRNRVRINCTHDTVLRMLPSLNIPMEALEEGLAVFEDSIEQLEKA